MKEQSIMFNFENSDTHEIYKLASNRGFLYGDAFFETMIFDHDHILLWDFHVNRIKKSIKILGMSEHSNFKTDLIPSKVKELYDYLLIKHTARVRIHFFRKEGGLYTPLSDKIETLISISESENVSIKSVENVGFAQSIYLQESPISSLKTNNCLPYILAGKEKKDRNLDEIIILDKEENVSEAVSSNIFWIKDHVIYTSPLSTGCIEGVRRSYICKKFNVIEKLISKETLLNSDAVFSTNVAGIYLFQNIESKFFDHQPLMEIFKKMI